MGRFMNDLLPRAHAKTQEGIEKRLHYGVQIYVSIAGGCVVDDAIGDARPGEPLTADHLMLLLSAGKPLIAAAIGQQLEQGNLSLNEPVARFIPQFGSAGKGPITIRHLLTHTAGLHKAESGWPQASWIEIISRICKSPIEPNWIPGERAAYDVASGWFILGELIRRVDGRPYDRYLREEICEPLRLDDLWNGIPPNRVNEYGDRLAPMFVSEFGGVLQKWDLSDGEFATACSPGGNTRGTARTLGRFYEALLAGRRGENDRVLRPETIREFTRPHRVGLFDETFQHVIDFGLGFILNSRRYGPATVPYGYGPVATEATFGHGGSQSSIAFADPERDLVVVIVCNGRPGEARHQRRMRQLLEALESDLGDLAFEG